MERLIRTNKNTDTDIEGPQTYGSGSGTLDLPIEDPWYRYRQKIIGTVAKPAWHSR
jgi:hypothetical protein